MCAVGDTPTRSGTFEALACGCIPIFFSRASFSYPWHVPDPDAIAIFIESGDDGPTYKRPSLLASLAARMHLTPRPQAETDDRIMRVHAAISRISPERERHMRANIIRLLPNMSYSESREGPPDAITVALRHIRATVPSRSSLERS